MKLLLVQDDLSQARVIKTALSASGHEINHVVNWESAARVLKSETIDLLIFDWARPSKGGLEVLQWVRGHLGTELGAIFLTGLLYEPDIALALEAGADDYVATPIRVPELVARVNTMLRRPRVTHQTAQVVNLGAYAIDVPRRNIALHGKVIDMTAREFELVAHLFTHIGKVVSRDHLARLAWGRGLDCMSRTIDTHVYRIRRKLCLQPENGVRLATVYTQGYRLDEVTPYQHRSA